MAQPDVGRIFPGAPGRLGRFPTKSDTRALMFARFATPPKVLPVASNFWTKRARFPQRSFGNLVFGSCTRSKQAVAQMRFERLEVRRTAEIADEEIVRVYVEMSNRRYGGGDNGAFETDALNDWRDPATTFRDTKARPLTIDAFVRLNPFDHDELKAAFITSDSKGIAVCLNLPLAFMRVDPPDDWDIPVEGATLTGSWMPGSWGGHSMWAFDYDAVGIWLDHTWERPPQRITWRAAAVYLDEAHLVIDSIDAWRKRKKVARLLDLAGIKAAVNKVSKIKVA